mmetsp:Transcript_46697/g.78382  ORF Transcript_46697/g.78382 Transcript_46697/m.78382 type:complete len:367 (+) Transcript_46697:1067-2167(+)
MIHAHNRGLDDILVHVDGTLYLGCPHAVPAHIQHIIHAPRDPVIPVCIPASPIACKIIAWVHREIRLLVPLVVPVHTPADPWMRLLDHQEALALALQLLTLFIDDGRFDAEEWQSGRAWLQWSASRQRSDHDATSLGLPPCIHDGACLAAHDVMIPLPGLTVDGLPNTAENAEARQIVLCDGTIAKLHEGPDRRRGRVEDGALVLIAQVPAHPCVGVCGHSFEDDAGGAVEQRPKCNVGMARDPPDVRSAPEDVVLCEVKDVLRRGCCINHITSGTVDDALGLPGAPGGVKQKQRLLRLPPDHFALRVGGRHLVLQPEITALFHGAIARSSLVNQHLLDGVPISSTQLDSLVHDSFKVNRLWTSHH